MGHSDTAPLREISGSPIAIPPEEVRVWGDPSEFAPACEPEDAPQREAGDSAPAASTSASPAAEAPATEDIYKRIGHLTRTLHDAMRELGYQESLSSARDNLPDARDRLAYIARLTGDAAEKVLNSVDKARSVQDEASARARSLRTRWAAVATFASAGERTTPAGSALIEETCSFLQSLEGQAEMTNGILTDIMMAQDFHDLTGQVIRKIIDLAHSVEEQLVKLLIDATPVEQLRKMDPGVLEGPVINPETRTDVVQDQAGVDDLLASLGF